MGLGLQDSLCKLTSAWFAVRETTWPWSTTVVGGRVFRSYNRDCERLRVQTAELAVYALSSACFGGVLVYADVRRGLGDRTGQQRT